MNEHQTRESFMQAVGRKLQNSNPNLVDPEPIPEGITAREANAEILTAYAEHPMSPETSESFMQAVGRKLQNSNPNLVDPEPIPEGITAREANAGILTAYAEHPMSPETSVALESFGRNASSEEL